ncbi:MAG: SAM-dependent methyltransferase [Hydrocarboniphaga sp.]|uniref:class I SAM-dependent methyltransferase n=1 Tax=Hydrocarboniphaga sp. TaxID=2033016 RepID=UPI00262071FE|nr:class I SAM-dependent methyltransferase [Hydrocarboniphaga sp.]MDB5972601.1 SAM-dependent methyltransferase [Hydrocarboniphaga sp.]
MNRDDALSSLLQALSERAYRFVTPTPLTHARVLARAGRQTARTLSDVFGWSLPFESRIVGDAMLSLMRDAGVLLPEPGGYRSTVRVSALDGHLFLHSAYPTLAGDAVFFGPDTYRFANFVNANLPAAASTLRCADIGCGSGAGAISAAGRLSASEWLLTDINAAALRLAEVNARHAGVAVQTVLSDVLAAVDGGFDLIICNPPYLADEQQRAYRHGGGDLGRELGLRIAAQACARLRPGGRLLLYTGVAIVDGVDPFLAELQALLDGRDCRWRYIELDPDVFGEELERPVYAHADRIAAVGLCVERP